jgi:hypothetical protein
MWRLALHLRVAEALNPHTIIANAMTDFEKTSSSSELSSLFQCERRNRLPDWTLIFGDRVYRLDGHPASVGGR